MVEFDLKTLKKATITILAKNTGTTVIFKVDEKHHLANTLQPEEYESETSPC